MLTYYLNTPVKLKLNLAFLSGQPVNFYSYYFLFNCFSFIYSATSNSISPACFTPF